MTWHPNSFRPWVAAFLHLKLQLWGGSTSWCYIVQGHGSWCFWSRDQWKLYQPVSQEKYKDCPVDYHPFPPIQQIYRQCARTPTQLTVDMVEHACFEDDYPRLSLDEKWTSSQITMASMRHFLRAREGLSLGSWSTHANLENRSKTSWSMSLNVTHHPYSEIEVALAFTDIPGYAAVWCVLKRRPRKMWWWHYPLLQHIHAMIWTRTTSAVDLKIHTIQSYVRDLCIGASCWWPGHTLGDSAPRRRLRARQYHFSCARACLAYICARPAVSNSWWDRQHQAGWPDLDLETGKYFCVVYMLAHCTIPLVSKPAVATSKKPRPTNIQDEVHHIYIYIYIYTNAKYQSNINTNTELRTKSSVSVSFSCLSHHPTLGLLHFLNNGRMGHRLRQNQ